MKFFSETSFLHISCWVFVSHDICQIDKFLTVFSFSLGIWTIKTNKKISIWRGGGALVFATRQIERSQDNERSIRFLALLLFTYSASGPANGVSHTSNSTGLLFFLAYGFGPNIFLFLSFQSCVRSSFWHALSTFYFILCIYFYRNARVTVLLIVVCLFGRGRGWNGILSYVLNPDHTDSYYL